MLASDRWFDGKVGLLVSGAYAKRKSVDDTLRPGRRIGRLHLSRLDLDRRRTARPRGLRRADRHGVPGLIPPPAGTTGAALDAYKANAANYYNPMANPAAYAEMTGSDPAAYAKLYPNCAATAGQPVSGADPDDLGLQRLAGPLPGPADIEPEGRRH